MVTYGTLNHTWYSGPMADYSDRAVGVLLFFGGKKIPELMKGLGQGIKEFKKATKDEKKSEEEEEEKQKKIDKE